MLNHDHDNADNLRQCNGRFSLISEQILAFASNTNLVKEVKKLCPNFRRIA